MLSEACVDTASFVTAMLLGKARSSSKRARRMCQSCVTSRRLVTLFRFAHAAVSNAFERVSTDWKPSAMQHLKYFADPGYCAASSRGFTSRSTPEISIFLDFPDFSISSPRSILFAPQLGQRPRLSARWVLAAATAKRTKQSPASRSAI